MEDEANGEEPVLMGTRWVQEREWFTFFDSNREYISEVIYIEILAETDYQDLYRITDGVLLVINKFKRIEYPSESYFHVYTSDAKYKSYNKGCQKWLKVLKEDYKNKYHDIVVPKGTVLYMDYPVESTSNKADWTYEIKTTASCLGGDFATTENMLNIILNIMKNKVSS